MSCKSEEMKIDILIVVESQSMFIMFIKATGAFCETYK